VSAVEPGSPAEQTISLDEVYAFRQRAIENGYPVIRVRSRSKAPLASEWQHGENPELLLDVRSETLNTGLVLAGLRCVDVDVDDPELVPKIMEQVRLHLPASALTRGRANSPRVSMLYRAVEGQPSKRKIKGPNGKREILGAGQQAVVHGLHPTGASITWSDGRGPDTVRVSDLAAVSEEQITEFLRASAPLLGASIAEPGEADERPVRSRFLEPGFVLPAIVSPSLAPIENYLGAGIESPNWFSTLTADEKRAFVRACLDALDNRTSDPREIWFRVLFAVADAGRLGCPDARQLALEWSQRGASWTSEADFDTAWESFRPGGISVGSLIAMARDAGLDLSPWRDPALARLGGTSGAAQCAGAICPRSMLPGWGQAGMDPLDFITTTANDAVQRINNEYFFRRDTSEICRQDTTTGEIQVLTPQQLKTALAGRWVEAVDPKNGKMKVRDAATVWLESRRRREVHGVQYCPNNIGLRQGHMNLWLGWGIEPAFGECSFVLDHIRQVVTGGDDQKAEFILNWCADILQNPTRKPGVALVLRGSEGTGKSALGAVLRRLLGERNVVVNADKDRLLGRFNSALAAKILIQAEESFFAPDSRTADALKHVITGQTLEIELKFGRSFEIGSFHRLLITSNHSQVIQASSEARRFVVCDVSDDRRGDAAYFDRLYAIADGRDDATARAFMQHLLNRDLSTFRPWAAQQQFLDDEALIRQKALSLSPPLAWLGKFSNRWAMSALPGRAATGPRLQSRTGRAPIWVPSRCGSTCASAVPREWPSVMHANSACVIIGCAHLVREWETRVGDSP
jgi:hypothetical protein